MLSICKEDNFKELLNGIENVENVYIYGTGLAAVRGQRALEQLGISIRGFIDKKADGSGILCGEKILPLSQIDQKSKIFIYANPEYGIHERLKKEGYENWVYVDPSYSYLYDDTYVERTYKQVISDRNKIEDVYSLLSDDKSREIYEAVINQRISHCMSVQRFSTFYDHNQYFGNDIVSSICGCYVDCGAYTGDTLKRFLSQIKSCKYSYHAFEADCSNSNQIELYCRENNISNVAVHSLAAWNEDTELYFEQDGIYEKFGGTVKSSSGKESSRIVRANSIDNVVCEKIDMIGMDIEGAEKQAIWGAKSHIENDYPILAISAYHRLQDLWEIPLEILRISADYNFFFRQHRWNIDDTVCYAVPKSRNVRCK